MSLWHIAWNYLWNRWFTTAMTILSVALAVGLISSILTIRNETRKRFEEEQLAYDIVVGPQGSPLQLVLNAIYYMDNPTGYMSYSDYLRIKEEEDVAHAFPVGLGDTYNSFRIVGTEKDIFDYPWSSDTQLDSSGEYKKRYPFQIKEGRFFEQSMEAVIGERVAEETGLTIGSEFSGTHGIADLGDHAGEMYTVVGILKPSGTSNDRAIFVDLVSVWELHATHDEELEEGHSHDDGHDHAHDHETKEIHKEDQKITAVLVDLESSSYRFTFMETILDDYKCTPAVPIIQVTRLYDKILGPVVAVLKAVGYVVVIISALSIMIGLYLSIIQRKRDMAIMRALGASAYEIFGAVIIEAFLVTLIGILSGWVLGKLVAILLGIYVSQTYGLTIYGLTTSIDELKFFAVVAFVGLFAGIIPAWEAYQADIAEDLQAS